VHHRPGQVGDRPLVGAGRPAGGLDVADPTEQQVEGGLAGRAQGRVVPVEQVALPHHREVGRVADGEAGVGPAGGAQPLTRGCVRAGLPGGGRDGRPQQLEPFDGDGGEQGRLVGEVVGRGGVGHAQPPGQ
jgi:hypothetical protein